jgi:hypothetical protein
MIDASESHHRIQQRQLIAHFIDNHVLKCLINSRAFGHVDLTIAATHLETVRSALVNVILIAALSAEHVR